MEQGVRAIEDRLYTPQTSITSVSPSDAGYVMV